MVRLAKNKLMQSLVFICLVAVGLLGIVNALVDPKVFAAVQFEEQAAFKEVMPLAANFTAIKSSGDKKVLYYKAFDLQGKLIGFVFKANGQGYSSVIETLAGIFPDGRISAIKIISLDETLGLGMRVTEDKFTGQFNQQNSLDLSGVQAITGASISSRAVMNSVMQKAQEIKELINTDKIDKKEGAE